MKSKMDSPPSISTNTNQAEPPPPYESAYESNTMDDLERGPERDFEPGFEFFQPLFDLLAGTFGRQGRNPNCLAFCLSLFLCLASLAVFILNEIGKLGKYSLRRLVHAVAIAFGGLVNAIAIAFGGLVHAIAHGFGGLAHAFGGVAHAIAIAFGSLIHAIAIAFGGIVHAIAIAFGGLIHAIAIAFGGLVRFTTTILIGIAMTIILVFVFFLVFFLVLVFTEPGFVTKLLKN